jgi:hypothetical protein
MAGSFGLRWGHPHLPIGFAATLYGFLRLFFFYSHLHAVYGLFTEAPGCRAPDTAWRLFSSRAGELRNRRYPSDAGLG